MEEARAEGRLPALLSAPSYREHILYNVWCCRDFYFSLSPEEIVAFAEKNGCPATLEEIKSFFEEQSAAAGELSDEKMAMVAGGAVFTPEFYTPVQA